MKKTKKKIRNVYVYVIFLIIIIVSIIMYVFNKNSSKIIISYANMQTDKIAIEVIRSCALEEVNKIVLNNDLYYERTNENGEIESIDINTPILNQALVTISKSVRKRLNDIEHGKNVPDGIKNKIMNKKLKKGIIYEVPLGIVFNNAFLKNLGPKIPVKIDYLENVSLDVKSRIKPYGIDSALIEIYIRVSVTERIILPFVTKEVTLKNEIPIIYKVVKGNNNDIITSKK